MEQVLHVATSEFFWGIVIGLLLAVVVAGVNIWLDNKRRRRTVAALLQDLIESVSDLIQNLEDNRHRNNIIHREFLFSIKAELGVYTRNREIWVSFPMQNYEWSFENFSCGSQLLSLRFGGYSANSQTRIGLHW